MKIKYLPIIAAMVLAGCDDGDIQEKVVASQTGLKIAIDANLSGVASWPSYYSVAVSGYENAANTEEIAEYSVISKQMLNDVDGKVHLTLGGIPTTVNYIEIGVINQIRQREFTIFQYEFTEDDKKSRDTIRIDAGIVDAGIYNRIQKDIFDISCTRCHGDGNNAAANMHLTEGNSYSSLVGVLSSKETGLYRVYPGDSAASVIHRVLLNNYPEVHMPHGDILDAKQKSKLLKLIDYWIEDGAKED